MGEAVRSDTTGWADAPPTAATLLVVGGRRQTLEKTRALGLGVVSLQHPSQPVPEAVGVADAVLVADFTAWECTAELVLGAHRSYGFSRAVSLTEVGLEPASRINDQLGLGGTPASAIRLLADKSEMRRHLAARAGTLPVVAAQECTGGADLRAFGDRHGYPLVVKPVAGTASLGTTRVDGPGDIEAAVARMASIRAGDHPYPELFSLQRFLVEPYLPGPEYSVEAFSFHGRHVAVAVTEKQVLPNLVEIGHTMPAPLGVATERAIVEHALSFLDTVGVVDGASHTEIKLTDAGPVVLESHNRIGGDRIVDLLELAYGIDFEACTVAWAAGRVAPWQDRPQPHSAAATRFLTAPPGTVTDIRGVAEVREQADVVDVELAVAPGSVVRDPVDSWARVGQVLVTADDPATASDRCRQLVESISVVTS